MRVQGGANMNNSESWEEAYEQLVGAVRTDSAKCSQQRRVSNGTVPGWAWGHHRELGFVDEVCGGRLRKSWRR
jgi:hypothetical protein